MGLSPCAQKIKELPKDSYRSSRMFGFVELTMVCVLGSGQNIQLKKLFQKDVRLLANFLISM